MNQKRELIDQMLEMQKKFIDYEHKEGVNPHDYFTPSSGHVLDGYRREYEALAERVVNLAHEDKGSKRD